MIPFLTNIEVVHPAGHFLAGRGANFTSQFGEDGLIAASLEHFGAENQCCFEVGAHDGVFLSNTHRLRYEGWKSVLIEADAEIFRRLVAQESPDVRCVNERIGPDSLDRLLVGMPANLDLGVIDIDGQDYWIWDGLKQFRPRLMLVEFEYATDHLPAYVPPRGGDGQANYEAIKALGISKGYVPLVKTIVNLLFVAEDVLTNARTP